MYPFDMASLMQSPFMLGQFGLPQTSGMAGQMYGYPQMNYSQAMGGQQVHPMLQALQRIREQQIARTREAGAGSGYMPSNMQARTLAVGTPKATSAAGAGPFGGKKPEPFRPPGYWGNAGNQVGFNTDPSFLYYQQFQGG